MPKIYLSIFITICKIYLLSGQNPFMAESYYSQNKFEEAIKEYILIIPLVKKSSGEYDTTLLVHYYDNMASSYKALNNIDSSGYYNHKIIQIAEYHQLFYQDYYQYKVLLYSNNLSELGKKDEAEKIVSSIYLKYKDVIPDSVKLLFLSFKRDYLDQTGNINEIEKVLIEKENIIRNNFDSNWIKVENELSILATNYFFIDKHEKADALYLETIKIARNKYGNLVYETASYYLLAVNFYLNTGQLSKAEELLELVNKCLPSDDNHSNIFFDYLSIMGRFYEIQGDLNNSLNCYLKYLDIKEKSGDDLPSEIFNNIGLIYMKLNDFNRAEHYFLKSVGGENHIAGRDYTYATFCNNMGNVMFEIRQLENAKLLFNNAILILEEKKQLKSTLYFMAINNLANVYAVQDSLDIAFNLLKINYNNIDTTDGKFKQLYGLTLFNLSGLAYRKNHYLISLEMLNEFNNVMVSIYGNSYPLLAEYQYESGNRFELIGDMLKSDSLFHEGLSTVKREYENSKIFLSESSGEKYLGLKDQKFSINKSYFKRRSENVSYFEEAYDCELFQKYFLLLSGIQMRREIFKNCSNDCLTYFNEWDKNRNYLANEYSKPLDIRSKQIKETEIQTDQLESRLMKISSSFMNFKKNKVIRWKDIQKKLTSNQVAIEFSSFRYRSPNSWTDSILYIGLILRANDSHPQMVTLFEQKQLDSIFVRKSERESSQVNNIYKNKRLYELIWKPIEKYVKPGDQIYFSPSGSIHQISLGAITNIDFTYLSDLYTFYQVGSTGVLASHIEGKQPVKDVAIFGGIDFDASEEQIAIAAKDIVLSDNIVSRSLYTQESTRSGKWTYLNGTLDEALSIDKMAKSKNIQSQLFTGSQAIEERFKSLSGKKSPSVIHIATHGFFFPDPKIDKKRLELMSFQSDNTFTLADNPMNRSGLLLAGANKAWIGEKLTTNREDGILTAYEVSNMSLFNTELVVLSACETGLGDIKGSEGVYGLQRAFKQAGVRYLMMSLWKVPDLATKEFMTTFYTEYLTHQKPVREAFNVTQSKMKDKYRNEPYKWGGFVLID